MSTAADPLADDAPILATPFQLEAEKLALTIMARADVQAAVAETRAQLRDDPASARPEGRAALDRAVALWLGDITLREIAFDHARPQIIHSPAIRPRTWHGHTFPGSGTAGDSPDNVQRSTFMHGGYRYLLSGRLPKSRCAQFTLAFAPDFHVYYGVGRGREALPYNSGLGMLRDDQLQIGADGRFEITIDSSPADGRANHFQLPDAAVDIWVRENLSDWTQQPMRLAIRRLDDHPSPPPLTEDEIAARVIEGHADLAGHWARHKETFFGHPPANTLGGPMYRKGGFGYLSFGFFDLADDEALLATIDHGGAEYASWQVLDRWYLALDRGPGCISRNNRQVIPNADGSVTYVMARDDPGAPNWIDTGGVGHGTILVRQQGVADAIEPKVRDYRVVKLDQIRGLLPADTPWVTPDQRRAEIERRAVEIDMRYRR